MEVFLDTNTSINTLIRTINSDETEIIQYFKEAKKLTSKYYQNKRVLFNPIYVSNICLGDCPYCGYKVSNKGLKRETLTSKETVDEANFLKNRNVKNILVLAGNYKHDKYVEMLSAKIRAIKKEVNPNWLGIEVATLDISEYKLLFNAGAESVTVFQETYNKQRYNELHTIPEYKGNYEYRYNAQERAIKAGFEEVGFGVLYGVGFWKDDTIAMVEQALQLREKYPNVKFRFSFPRLQKSIGQVETCRTETVTDFQLKKIIIAIRLLFPKANLVLTGRENNVFLINQLPLVNIIGYDGSTIVGGYTKNTNCLQQFELNTKLSFFEFNNSILKDGYEVN